MNKEHNTNKNKLNSIWILFKKFILVFLNINLFLLVTIIFIKSSWELHLQKNTKRHELITLTIPKNKPLKEIIKELVDKKIIVTEAVAYKWLKRLDIDKKIRSGKFIINPNESLLHILMKLSTSIAFIEKITVREGLTINETAYALSKAGIDENKFITLCKNRQFIEKLGIKAESLEGYLFPDTYLISYGTEESAIIGMMVKRFQQIIESINIQQSIIYKTTNLKKGLIIASIIEKESGYIPEYSKISSVFWNRLKADWRIDSDVTVRYALQKWNLPLSKSDLNYSSPYNTRKYKGLPPAPICNPSKAALKAAFFPEQTKYMFFVSKGEKDGSSFFSKSLKEHNEIVKNLRSQGKLGL